MSPDVEFDDTPLSGIYWSDELGVLYLVGGEDATKADFVAWMNRQTGRGHDQMRQLFNSLNN